MKRKIKRENKINIFSLLMIMATVILLADYILEEVPSCVSFTPQNISAEEEIMNYTIPLVTELNQQIEYKDIVFSTSGNSMEPLIHSNQLCNCEKSEEYKVGDTVIYFADLGKGYQAIAHQVVFTDGEIFTIKGLNNSVADGNILKEDILCKIKTVRRIDLLNG